MVIFIKFKKNIYGKHQERVEGALAILASLLIFILGQALLRTAKMKDKLAEKLAKALNSDLKSRSWFTRFRKKLTGEYVLIWFPLVTVTREGIEAAAFITGVIGTSPGTSLPLPFVCGLLAGGVIGFLIYK